MVSLLDGVKTFESGASPERFSELTRVFPKQHFAALLKEGFAFFRTTFWYPLEQQPTNVFESVIADLRARAEPSMQVTGVEWWFSVALTNKTPQWLLPCHFDRNDLMEKNSDKLEYPEKASVLFLNSVPYGELVVTDQVMTKKGISPKQPNDMRFIQPRENLYAVFPGQLYHGVIGRMWRPLRKTNLRITMAVNWWRTKPKAAYLRESRDSASAFRLQL
jgi:hypothetical protein